MHRSATRLVLKNKSAVLSHSRVSASRTENVLLANPAGAIRGGSELKNRVYYFTVKIIISQFVRMNCRVRRRPSDARHDLRRCGAVRHVQLTSIKTYKHITNTSTPTTTQECGNSIAVEPQCRCDLLRCCCDAVASPMSYLYPELCYHRLPFRAPEVEGGHPSRNTR